MRVATITSNHISETFLKKKAKIICTPPSITPERSKSPIGSQKLKKEQYKP